MMVGAVFIAVGGTLLGPAPPRTVVAPGLVGTTIPKGSAPGIGIAGFILATCSAVGVVILLTLSLGVL